MGTIKIVGVTGTIGSRVARRLVAAGHDVEGLSRRPDPDGPARFRAIDLRDADAAARALEGAEAVYLTPPLGGEDPLGDEVRVGSNVIRAAASAGVRHLVLHTAVHADRGDTGARILDNKTAIEEAAAASGVPYTILRPAWYFQNLFLAKPYLDQGVFAMPWPAETVWAATDVEDVAAAAAGFLEGGPANRGFDVHVPGGVTAAGICRAVEATTGRPIAYQAFPGSTREAVDGYPISDLHKELYAELFDYFKAAPYLGQPEAITEALPGFRYGTLDAFLRRELYPGQEAVISA